MTELSFLLDLLLNHKLPKQTKEAITGRIKWIEERQPTRSGSVVNYGPVNTTQAPSMQRSIQSMEDDRLNNPPTQTQVQPTTFQAAKALQDRQELINKALNGKEEPGRTSPRKF